MSIWKTIIQASTNRRLNRVTAMLGAVGAVLGAAGSLYAYFKPSTPDATQTVRPNGNTTQSTSGANSPIINGNNGSVSYSVGASPAASTSYPSKPPTAK